MSKHYLISEAQLQAAGMDTAFKQMMKKAQVDVRVTEFQPHEIEVTEDQLRNAIRQRIREAGFLQTRFDRKLNTYTGFTTGALRETRALPRRMYGLIGARKTFILDKRVFDKGILDNLATEGRRPRRQAPTGPLL